MQTNYSKKTYLKKNQEDKEEISLIIQGFIYL